MTKKKKPDLVTDLPASTPYPTNVGAPKFAPLAIRDLKDQNKIVAREHANQKLEELNEQWQLIMKQAELVQQQARDIVDRVHITDWVLDSDFGFVIVIGKHYYLVEDTEKNKMILCVLGPNDWSGNPPSNYNYVATVRKLGDSTWERVD